MSNPDTSNKTTNSSGKQALLTGVAPITVGNPEHAASFAIDQSHSEKILAEGGAAPAPDDPRVAQAFGIFADLKALEVTPTTMVGAREILSTVAVRRPKNNEFVRVHPEPDYTLTTALYEDKDEGEIFFVMPPMRALVISGLVTKMLTLAVNQLGAVFIWPVPIDDECTRRRNQWNASARSGYQQAKTEWIKLVSDRSSGQYRIYVAEGKLPPPRWPDKTFAELLNIAFQGRNIDREDHPLVQAIRGRTV
jgi:hypothetical protein